jgi:hypothetical protein
MMKMLLSLAARVGQEHQSAILLQYVHMTAIGL